MKLTFEQFDKLNFALYEGNPIIRCDKTSTIVADPSVLTPDEAVDGKWHLFAHSMWGVVHYASEDGLQYARIKRILKDAMRPDINKVGDTYYLYYEHTQRVAKRGLAAIGKAKWHSELWLVTSKDLVTWSKPVAVVRHDRSYQDSGRLGVSISNPFMVEKDGKFRLYYSAGLSYLEDCHFSEPTYISYAESERPDGGFVSIDVPILRPDPKDPVLNRGCGCIKVYRLQDCYIGLLNGIYYAPDGSHSAVMLFKSEDGEHFYYVKHVIDPCMCGEDDWMAQYVYACNLALYQGKAYIFFNARNMAHPLKGREHIGVAIADMSEVL